VLNWSDQGAPVAQLQSLDKTSKHRLNHNEATAISGNATPYKEDEDRACRKQSGVVLEVASTNAMTYLH